MIENKLQYSITKEWKRRFSVALEEEKHEISTLDPILHKAVIDSLQSQIDDLADQIKEYENFGG